MELNEKKLNRLNFKDFVFKRLKKKNAAYKNISKNYVFFY